MYKLFTVELMDVFRLRNLDGRRVEVSASCACASNWVGMAKVNSSIAQVEPPRTTHSMTHFLLYECLIIQY